VLSDRLQQKYAAESFEDSVVIALCSPQKILLVSLNVRTLSVKTIFKARNLRLTDIYNKNVKYKLEYFL
jgi:hypothetical protein